MGSTSNHYGKILHSELKSGKFGGEVDTDISKRAADLTEEVSKHQRSNAGSCM